MLSWRCRWNRECADWGGLLKESGACGLKDLPKEVLIKIAECLDLATQANLWETDKHLYRTLGGEVQFVKDFESTACSALHDHGCHTEALALCGIKLLSKLPSFVSLQDSHVQVVYSDEQTLIDTVDIWYTEDQIIPGIPVASLFHVEYRAYATDFELEEEDEPEEENDLLLFEDTCDVSRVHRLLWSAPSPDRIPEVRQISSRLVLQSTLDTGSREDLIQCAQYCFDLMCSRRWRQSKIFITFPFPPPSPGLDSGHQAMKIQRSISSWSLNNVQRQSCPVKLDFACFPQGAHGVEAHFFSDVDVDAVHEPDYWIGTDLVRQQCMAFAMYGLV